MILPRIIPSLLLRGKGLVKGVGFSHYKYVGDPLNAVKIYNEKQVDELIFLDIDATKKSRTIPLDLVESIADECHMPFSVGGGIQNIGQIRELLYAGAEKVAINSCAITDPDLIKKAAGTFGRQSIIVSIDAKKNWRGQYRVRTLSGKKKTRLEPVDFARKMENMGAGEILINSIDQDGQMNGYDLTLIKKVAMAVNIPVIACGGAGSLKHLSDAIYEAKASAVAAGSMFVFHGPKKAVLISFPSQKERDRLFENNPDKI